MQKLIIFINIYILIEKFVNRFYYRIINFIKLKKK